MQTKIALNAERILFFWTNLINKNHFCWHELSRYVWLLKSLDSGKFKVKRSFIFVISNLRSCVSTNRPKHVEAFYTGNPPRPKPEVNINQSQVV